MRKIIVSLVLAAVMLIVPVVAMASVQPSYNRSSGSTTSTSASTATSAVNTAGNVVKAADGSETFVQPDGTLLKSNWAVVGNTWRYFGADGKMVKNTWIWIKGADGITKCYYLGADGACYLNGKTPDGYDVDANGAWVKNGTVQTK